MNDVERTGDDKDGVQQRDQDPFFKKMRMERHQRREFADTFACQQSEQPGVEDLLEDQRKHANQIEQLGRSVGRLRRSVLVANLFSGAVGLGILALAGYFYIRAVPGFDFTGERTLNTGSVRGQETSSGAAMMSDLVLESDLEFKIRTDVDRKYQLIIRQLFNNARQIRRPNGPIEVRNAATKDYIQYMADVSRVIEQAAQEQASAEITLAIMNLSMVGPELRKVEDLRDLNVETQNRFDQIVSVLHAHDTRSPNPDTRSTLYER